MRRDSVIVVTGIGGMGTAVARRLGSGSKVLLADVDGAALGVAVADLREDGYDVTGQETDVSDRSSVDTLARAADHLGPIDVVVHTAGVSPVQASVSAVLHVDLLGVALMLDTFGSVVARGGAGVFIASMAGTLYPHDPDLESRLATTPADDLLGLADLGEDTVTDAGTAYMIAKRANQVRVRAAALAWGRRGARVNSISPGVISTAMGNVELSGENGVFMRQVVADSPTGRMGTAHDIAATVEFLVGPNSSYITGTDLLVDGGVVASLLSGGVS